MNAEETTTRLTGEGDTRTQVRVRRECEECFQPATLKFTYILPGGRANPASSAYGRDDCSFCSDFELFLCGECGGTMQKPKIPRPAGYHWCAVFPAEKFPQMFLTWAEQK